MDKLQIWLRRIQQPPRREVANLDYWALLTETRIAREADLPPERFVVLCAREENDKAPRRTAG